MALKAGDMVDVVEKSESGMCPFLRRAPGGQPPPGHHFSMGTAFASRVQMQHES